MVYSYEFWLIVLSIACLIAERIKPWRPDQQVVRPLLGQDVFWLLFNGILFGIAFGPFLKLLYGGLDRVFEYMSGVNISNIALLDPLPFWAQAGVLLIIADFLEWCIHNALHRNALLWQIHRLHHSIRTMDWIGNFRFHWSEIILYQSAKYLPLTLLGARWEAILLVAVFSTAVGFLNHANLNVSWGPLRYVFNSPRMHIWHHDKDTDRPAGYNFAVVFSFWDWIFGTAYMPRDARQPVRLGFKKDEEYSDNLVWRFLWPASAVF
ncbi:MAG: hypothetical protein GF350_01315 [Chitinivibrionales bacterium]|nr:hypothetical protein [Chitinivibrionales bacterium]